MKTLPSLKALGKAFACRPRVKTKHPKLGLLHYEVELDTRDETIRLSVLPVAEEVVVSLFTKKPARSVNLSLGDVSKIVVIAEEEGGQRVEIHFHNTELQTLMLWPGPTVMLSWGNRKDTPDSGPPWERD